MQNGSLIVYQYGYLIISLMFLAIWGLLYFKANSLRKPMIVLSILTMLAGPISEFWYFKDYWRPLLIFHFPVGGIEDMIFGFAIGGIAAFSYEIFFINQICYCKMKTLSHEWFLIFFGVIEFLTMILLNNILKINSIFASSIGMIISAVIMLLVRSDLIINAVASGFLVSTVMFTVYFIPMALFPQAHAFIRQLWLLYGKPEGILLFGHIPLTELIWGFSWGLVWGPIYEFISGARTLTIKRVL